jgi:hypothetical protein
MSDENAILRTQLNRLQAEFTEFAGQTMWRFDRMDANHATALTYFQRILQVMSSTTNSIANLQAAVAAETTIDQSVLTLLTTLAAQIAAASPTGDNPAIDAVVSTMQANAATLAAAVTANTPTPPASP